MHAHETFSVSQINRKVKDLLENHFHLIWVEGEISNISKPGSGHWYFTLKDEHAQMSCAMFKRRNILVKFRPKVGDHVKIRGRVSLYEGRGDYQLIAEHMEEAGFGILQRRFEALKEKLRSEGLFDAALKRKMPRDLLSLGVITSPSGAAVRDVLSVLKRRFPALPITIIPTAVQGEDAPDQIIRALNLADKQNYSALILCRGGGSIEDLWAFNSEKLARAIAECKTPIACAVGHEIDFTIADFVADLRAPTPSAAAEMLSPDQDTLIAQLIGEQQRLKVYIQAKLRTEREKLAFLRAKLRHPREKLEHWHQRLDQLEIRLTQAIKNKQLRCTQRLTAIQQHPSLNMPMLSLTHHKAHIARLEAQINNAARTRLSTLKKSFEHTVSALHIISPIATIARGYSIASTPDNSIVRSLRDIEIDQPLHVRVIDGRITTLVKEKIKIDE